MSNNSTQMMLIAISYNQTINSLTLAINWYGSPFHPQSQRGQQLKCLIDRQSLAVTHDSSAHWQITYFANQLLHHQWADGLTDKIIDQLIDFSIRLTFWHILHAYKTKTQFNLFALFLFRLTRRIRFRKVWHCSPRTDNWPCPWLWIDIELKTHPAVVCAHDEQQLFDFPFEKFKWIGSTWFGLFKIH